MGFLSKIESIRAVMLRLNWNTPCLAACDRIPKMVSLVSLIRSARWWAWWQHFQRKSHEKGFFLRNFHLSCRKKFILLCGQEFQCQGLPYWAYESLGRLSIFLVWKTWWQLVLLSQYNLGTPCEEETWVEILQNILTLRFSQLDPAQAFYFDVVTFLFFFFFTKMYGE